MKLNILASSIFSILAALVAADSRQVPLSSPEVSENTDQGSSRVEVVNDSPDTDNKSWQGPYRPWTHKPVCTEDVVEQGEQLCVYTNASFSNGRGVSIFTRPSIAKEFAMLQPVQNSSAMPNDINPPAHSKKQPWYTSDTDSKGTAMFAARSLKRGDQIAAYTPYLLIHMENAISTKERERFLQIAISQLPPRSQEVYVNLAKIYNEPSVVVQDVVKANAFEIQVGGTMHLAVFPEASRFNHACAPNAQYFLSPSLLTHYVHAVRDIAKDEELTISYAPPLRLHADRQSYFESTFHFTCTCSRCTNQPDSDDRTKDIIALQWALGQWTPNSTASVRKAEMLVRLYKEEGLDAFLDDAYGHAAFTYNAVGSPRGATKYADLAAEATWLKYGWERGGGYEKIKEWRQLAADPKGHSSWRKRKDKK